MSINLVFSSPYVASLLAARVPKPFHIHAKKEVWQKKKFSFVFSRV